ncbi:FAD-linked oxidoreductase OXR1 [Physcia stellaris]|nr:FAD-linked oxidoreductase OXR1 [Physcia stellaris]
MLLKSATVALYGLWCLSVSAIPFQPGDIRALLSQKANGWDKSTTISFPQSSRFVNSTSRWSTYDAPTYLAAISPASETDVAKAVKIASLHNIPFLATGGRHGYTTTLGELDGGLAIDLSQLKAYSIDKAAGQLTIGGATTLADFQNDLFAAGYMIQSGSISCPGYLGVTVGSGVGRLNGLFGLVADALVSARIVVADGRVVTASRTQNSDLFWGLRGAGANLGIVTSATYKAHKLVNQGQILNADFILPANQSKQYFDFLGSLSGKMPANLAVITLVVYDPVSKGAQIIANWVYIGTKDEGMKLMAPLLALESTVSNISVVPWNKLVGTAAFGADALICPKNQSHNTHWATLRKLSGPTFQTSFEKLDAYFRKYPSAHGTTINLETFPNQAMMAVADDDSAYPWRDALGHIQLGVMTDSNNAPNDPAATAGQSLALELRDTWAKNSGYPDLSVYINYARGDERLEQRYGARKLPRLAALKKKWDPSEVFRFNNALPTSYP